MEGAGEEEIYRSGELRRPFVRFSGSSGCVSSLLLGTATRTHSNWPIFSF